MTGFASSCQDNCFGVFDRRGRSNGHVVGVQEVLGLAGGRIVAVGGDGGVQLFELEVLQNRLDDL